ncbi:spore coat U domain-containing protein [Telmatobacter sp. DSM 110680]|uniref:Spore coat U domain-containing protein n=1 Tax=Telmatobacter sp. DSM 110680 TaxID=3036704 RepID=A0AAU7DR30_9BACT
MMRRLELTLFLIVACSSQRAAAQTGCTLSITTLNFGVYNAALLNGTATGTVICAGSWNIPLNAGTGAGATETIRKMTGPGGAELSYELFTNAARTTNWGNTTGNEATGTGNATITVYGQIPAGQYFAQGTYSDTVSSATESFTVTVQIQATCTIAANPLNFGAYSGASLDASTSLSVSCTKAAAYNVGLSAGAAPGATVTNRSMTGPAASLLSYKLFSNSGYSTNWGNTVGTDTLLGVGTGVAQSLTVYGQIPAGQWVRPGSYSDTITATLTY